MPGMAAGGLGQWAAATDHDPQVHMGGAIRDCGQPDVARGDRVVKRELGLTQAEATLANLDVQSHHAHEQMFCAPFSANVTQRFEQVFGGRRTDGDAGCRAS